jgi:hypothetical protein
MHLDHVARGAGQIARRVTDPDGAYGLLFSPCEFEDEVDLTLCLGSENGGGSTSEGVTPVLEHGSRRRSVDGEGSEETIEFVEGDIGWREWDGRRHGESEESEREDMASLGR